MTWMMTYAKPQLRIGAEDQKDGLGKRASTLMTAAQAALRDPDREPVDRQSRATRYAIEAAERKTNIEGILADNDGIAEPAIHCLAHCVRGGAGGPRRTARRLQRVRPDLEARIDEASEVCAAPIVSAAAADQFIATVQDPAMRAFIEGVSAD
ncbi:MAG: hypothetical protein R3F65_25480 [bacterium]